MGKFQCDISLTDHILDEKKWSADDLITVFQRIQDVYGYLPKEAIYRAAAHLGVSAAKAAGVASFYSQFREEPAGKYMISLCTGTACQVNGSENIAAAIEEVLGISDGETTADGLFTLEFTACIGCCSLAPAMMINGETYGSLTREKTIRILKEYISAEKRHAAEKSKEKIMRDTAGRIKEARRQQ